MGNRLGNGVGNVLYVSLETGRMGAIVILTIIGIGCIFGAGFLLGYRIGLNRGINIVLKWAAHYGVTRKDFENSGN